MEAAQGERRKAGWEGCWAVWLPCEARGHQSCWPWADGETEAKGERAWAWAWAWGGRQEGRHLGEGTEESGGQG